MACEKKEKVLAFLKGNLVEEEAAQIERHIETCPECSGIVEGYMEKMQEITIPRQEYQGEEHELKEQAVQYQKGTARIVVFTIVGIIMGLFARVYVTQEFFPIKLILCIPYKCSEILYEALGANAGSIYTMYDYWGLLPSDMRSLFPFDNLVRVLAEYLTPALFGGAIYGSLAYFTGDKRIFTLTKYLKFAIIWLCVIGLYIGGMFGFNSFRKESAGELKNVKGFMLETESSATTFMRSWEETGAWGQKLYDSLFVEEGLPARIEDTSFITADMREEEIMCELFTGVGGAYTLHCRINTEEGYMTTIDGKYYRVSTVFASMVRAYYDKAAVVYYDEERQTWVHTSKPLEEIWDYMLEPDGASSESKGGVQNEE